MKFFVGMNFILLHTRSNAKWNYVYNILHIDIEPDNRE